MKIKAGAASKSSIISSHKVFLQRTFTNNGKRTSVLSYFYERKFAPSELDGLDLSQLSQDPEETILILGQVKVGVTTEEEHPKLKDFKTCLKGEGEQGDCGRVGLGYGLGS